FQMGFTYSRLHNTKKSIEYYKKTVELDPEAYEAWYNLGKQYQDELEEYKKAIQCYKEVIKLSPKFSYAWNNMGLAYVKLNNHEKAIECYHKAIEYDPENEIAWVNIAICYYFLKNYEKSMDAYRKAFELDPLDYQAQMSMMGAMESIQNKVKPTRENKYIWIKMGVNYLDFGIFEKAILCFKKIIEIDPQDYEVWHNIGRVYKSLNDHKIFIGYFKDISELFKDLKRISIITTSLGPLVPDVFWLFESEYEIAIFPLEGQDSDLLKKAQTLPRFDNEAVIRAMSSTQDDFFICWEKDK
ncbi:MAG: tetratricopeptide repeat protein, partial [Candidatus Helarchaeota archaeon]